MNYLFETLNISSFIFEMLQSTENSTGQVNLSSSEQQRTTDADDDIEVLLKKILHLDSK